VAAAVANSNNGPPSNSKCLADELQEALLQEVHQQGNDYDDDDDVFLPDSTNQTKNSQNTKVYPKFSGNYLEELKKLTFNCVSKNTRPYLTSNNVYLAEDSTDDSPCHLSVASTGGRRRRNSSGDG